MLQLDSSLIAQGGASDTPSSDWDEVNDFCRRVYMPYRVTTSGRMIRPKATLQGTKVAQIKVTRFAYGLSLIHI